MTLGERIKKLRKEKDLTQQQFCNLIGFKQNSISLVESGKRNISDQAIKSICREFNISEAWLQTGEGEMFVPTPETAIDEIIRDYGLDDLDRQIITEYLQLSEADRQAVKRYIQRVAQHIRESPDKTLEQEADEFAAMAREQFISEKKQASQTLSVKESDVG